MEAVLDVSKDSGTAGVAVTIEFPYAFSILFRPTALRDVPLTPRKLLNPA